MSRVGTAPDGATVRGDYIEDLYYVRAVIFGGTQHAFARSGFEVKGAKAVCGDQDGWHGCLQARLVQWHVTKGR
ncbi:hypothetical protein PC117_g21735 [Phytophthora cactorum]|uniref:Uncharacterized protein n=1 Tax=Phytophthora cactorum TaxID=29920 RepID=A0A8T1BFE9_9STRA|nr:hypothetical protein PC117_g21735 [Phytophthora cactorum]